MLLKTIQPQFILSQITEKKENIYSHFFPDKESEWSFKEAYEWIAQNKMQHLKNKSPDNSIIWAWEYDTPENIRKSDEMIKHQVEAFTDTCISIIFESDEDHSILSDHELWHFPLNYWNISTSQKETEYWENLEKQGISFYNDKPLKDEKHHKEIMKSWDLAFKIKKNPETGNYNYDISPDFFEFFGLKKEDCLIQATLWSIPLKNIKEVSILKS